MTRPHIIRADTIDLQDQDAPSAKDHSRQHARPGGLGEGSPAPHQADALKHVELELSEQHGRSPRASQDLSGKELQLLHDEDIANDRDPSENLLRNSALHNGGMGSEDDMEGVEGDDGLDDDMMDKISSSPSIGEDGGYSLPLASLPPRGHSPRFSSSVETRPSVVADSSSSSPFTEAPGFFPLSLDSRYPTHSSSSSGHHHHSRSRFPGLSRKESVGAFNIPRSTLGSWEPSSSLDHAPDADSCSEDSVGSSDPFDTDFDTQGFRRLLLPTHDPLLEGLECSPEKLSSKRLSSKSDSSWESSTNGEEDDDENDDEAADISFVDDSRFIDSGWGGECLRDIEEIDFDFVYALHTFVATVEGQANATKGDTMVLLDDSNSYWWLVRVVKDSSIGYLPAEHIETPTERLARLNKHRNLDLSQTMLTDQEEDKRTNPLNPLKKAMRRRNVKTVQFAPPSYVEPADYSTTSDEEEEDNDEETQQQETSTESRSQEPSGNTSDKGANEPVATREQQLNGNGIEHTSEQELRNGVVDTNGNVDKSRTSDDGVDRSDEAAISRSRKGNVRNTDSFFKDDSVETRKINLTPSLLRDDSSSINTKSSDSTLKARPSLDSIGKDTPTEKTKDEKKKKEKRGMLGGMFKRKDKKSKGQEKEGDDPEKTSGDFPRQSPQPKESMESLSQDAQAPKGSPQPHRQTSKLQKQPPAKLSPKNSYQQQKELSAQKSVLTEPENTLASLETSRAPAPYVDPNGMTRAQAGPQMWRPDESPQSRSNVHNIVPIDSNSLELSRDKARAEPPMVKETSNTPAASLNGPEFTGKAGARIDDSDASSLAEDEPTRVEATTERTSHDSPAERTVQKVSAADQHHLAIAQAAQYEHYDPQEPDSSRSQSQERLSESPVQVLPQDSRQHDLVTTQQRVTPHQPPPLVTDTSSTEEPSTTSPLSPSSSPELIDHPSDTVPDTAGSTAKSHEKETEKPESLHETLTATTTPASSGPAEHPSPSSTSTTPTWSDASLRAYLDNDDSDIRDLLLVVHDKTGVVPRKDHPVVRNMYREENRRLDAVSNNLDNLLGQYLARKKGNTRVGGNAMPVR